MSIVPHANANWGSDCQAEMKSSYQPGANGAMAGTALIGIILFAGIAWLGYSAYGLVGKLGMAKAVIPT